MIIDQKLKDPAKCDGCLVWPRIIFAMDEIYTCRLKYIIKPNLVFQGDEAMERPQQCIDERGL